jgi:GT2 family glycosyltransferase
MPTSPDERVAVVIATHNRAAHLALTLDALERQTSADFDIIVVDDESTDDTPRLLAERGVRTLRVRRGGPGQARQQGWRETDAAVVAFTDDDCIPSPGWLEHLVRPLRDGVADFAQGRTIPRPDQIDGAGPWARSQSVEREDGLYQTCNIAYRRDVLEAVGGFRRSFAGPLTAGEDTDLAWRALEAGFRSAFAPRALVEHEVWDRSYGEHLRDRRRWANTVQVAKFHPGIRRLVYRRYFYRRSHARAIAIAAGTVAAARVRPWLPLAIAAGAAGAYIVRTRDSDVPPASRCLRLGQVLVADAVEVAMFAAASVRYRTFLV